jgi:transposase InsO family protein
MKKSYKPEQIVRLLQDVQVQLAAGASIREVAKQLAVNSGTLCRWLRRYGGMEMEEASGVRAGEGKRAAEEDRGGVGAGQERSEGGVIGKALTPGQRRQLVNQIRKRLRVSERSACQALSQPRSTQRYEAQQRSGERGLCERMRDLSLRHPRYGYRRITVLLRAEGFKVNRKRVHRLWRKEGLKVPQKQHKKRRLAPGTSANSIVRRRAERPHHVWSFDFCHDRTVDARPLKIFSVIDEFTRRCLAIRAEHRLTGADVVKVLKKLIRLHGVPEHVRCDNGPEFVCAAVCGWTSRVKIGTLYIEPASPWENGITESYHSRLRDELLDREEFASLRQAQVLLEIWRQSYNEERPHGALGYRTPSAFADGCRGAGTGFAALSPCRHRDEESLVESAAR